MNDEKKREARRAYKRRWNAANKDKIKAAQARYMERRIQAAALELLRRAAEIPPAENELLRTFNRSKEEKIS